MSHEPKHQLRIVEIDADNVKRRPVAETTIRKMYDLLGSNMARIIPTSGPDWETPEEFEKWKRDVFLDKLRKRTRHILLLDNDNLKGFVSYTVPVEGTEIYLNEVQIKPHAQGDGVTSKRLLSYFLEQIDGLAYGSVRTYTNNLNERAQRLIEKVGFKRESETDRGIRYTITKRVLQDRLRRLINNRAGRKNRQSKRQHQTC